MARKKKRKASKAGPIWRMSAEEATLAGKPRYNGFACGSGPHGDLKYNRTKAKRDWRKDIRSEGTPSGSLRAFEAVSAMRSGKRKTRGKLSRHLAERKDLSPTDPLFASTSNRNKGGRLTTRSISGIVKQALRNIGLDPERYTAHSLRHTGVTYAFMAGASVEEMQKMARHADISTTVQYAHHVDRIRSNAEAKVGSYLDEVL